MRLKPYLVLSSSLFSFLLCKKDSPILEGERQSEICRVVSQTYVRSYTSLQPAEMAVRKRLEGEDSHVAGGYSKLCPGLRAGTAIVTW